MIVKIKLDALKSREGVLAIMDWSLEIAYPKICILVLILDGNSEHLAKVWKKTSIYEK